MQESYGEKIRNLLVPYKAVIEKIEDGRKLTDIEFKAFQENYERLLRLSFNETMEHNFVKDNEII